MPQAVYRNDTWDNEHYELCTVWNAHLVIHRLKHRHEGLKRRFPNLALGQPRVRHSQDILTCTRRDRVDTKDSYDGLLPEGEPSLRKSLGVAQGMSPSQGNETEMVGSIGEINSRPWRPAPREETAMGSGLGSGQGSCVFERVEGVEICTKLVLDRRRVSKRQTGLEGPLPGKLDNGLIE